LRVKCDEFIGMLDAFVDGELDDEARDGICQHARICEDCARELKRAEALRKLLSGLDDEVRVPLAAQAAWRAAVKAEARKKRARGLYRALGAVAAACVVFVGVAAGMNLFGGGAPKEEPAVLMARDASDVGTFAFVASDGDESPDAKQATTPRTSEAAEMTATVRIVADDVAAAAQTVESLVGEFNGSVDMSSVDAPTAYLTARIPADEYQAFADSLSYAGAVETSNVSGEGGDAVSVTITIQKN
jgi:hypothetical protein